ncbi:MAG: hypothetical protein C0595_09355 [Marinilabiliales bacterium]|nr:MAG: hypothetical protein C0595_09355 [Marinilabiliales bacterium]
MFPDFNIEKSRYERKFVVDEMNYHSIYQQVILHPAAFKEIYSPRFINNIYLDTNELDFYFDNVAGKGSRKKARIRWYGDMLGNIENPVLEFKVREGFLGNKLSFPLHSFLLDENFTLDTLKSVYENSDLPDWAYQVLMKLKPSLLNRYKRKYTLNFDGDFRLTLDNDLSYHSIGVNNNSFMKNFKSNDVIVELKYDFEKDKKATQITNKLPFRLTKSSKYVNGIDFMNYMLT